MNRGKRKLLVTGILVALSVIAALIISVIIGSSGGASTPSTTKPTISTSPQQSPLREGDAGQRGARKYQTVGSFVNVRAGASTDTAVIANMGARGTAVLLYCYVRGTSIAGDPWWYLADFGASHGYVSGFWVNTGPDPAKTHLPAC
jgi:hypothetical protein